MLAGSKDRTRTPRLHPFDAGGSRFCPLALEPRASLHRFPCSRQCKSILVRFPEQSATHKQPNICHSALPLRGVLFLQGPNDVRCVRRWATSRVGGRGARIRVGSSVTRKLRGLPFDSQSWMRTVAVCELCAGYVRAISFGKGAISDLRPIIHPSPTYR